MAPPARGTIAQEIREISAADELGQSFLPYSLSVITARALPDVRDGLKPVQRRILVAMAGMGLRPTTPHRKSAKVVGETMGTYHPHGDSAIYETLVRLGQPFSLRVPLVDPHGNFGSLDDPPAAPRYTECRLSEAALDVLGELGEDTIDYRPTYDGEGSEPEYLPSRLPNLLVNGSSGIAVGMATNMAPHNLGEVCAALRLMLARADRPPALDELMAVLPGPDFPGGGVLVDEGGLRDAYESGRGSVRVRARAQVAQVSPRRQGIVVTELPPSVGPERVIARIGELVQGGKLGAVTDVKDLTDRTAGLRIQIEVRSGSDPQAVLGELYRLTPMEETFAINNVVLVDGVPTTVGLHDLCRLYLEHRLEVVVRRTRYRLRRAEARAHVLEGLLVALDHIDRVIAIIRAAPTVPAAREALQSAFGLSEVQANAILDMVLRRLVALERQALADELAALRAEIAELSEVLGSEARRRELVAAELAEVAERHGTPRRTRLTDAAEAPRAASAAAPISFELGDDPCTITLSSSGLAGRELGATRVGGGRLGRHDVLVGEVRTSKRQSVWAVTDRGRALHITALEVPEVAGRGRGAATSELFAVQPGERVVALVGPGEEALVLVSATGLVKRLDPGELGGGRDGSVIMALDPADRLVAVFPASSEGDLVIVAGDGQALRTAVAAIPTQGRAARGVAGMRLRAGARVVAAGPAVEGGLVLTVSDGDGVKLTAVDDVPRQGRAAGGVRLVRLRPAEGFVRLAVVSGPTPPWCLLAQPDDPNRMDAQPQPAPVALSRRDGPTTRAARRVLAAGTARW